MHRLSILFAGAFTVLVLAFAASAYAAPVYAAGVADRGSLVPDRTPIPDGGAAVLHTPGPKPPAVVLVDERGFSGGHEEGEEHEGFEGHGHVFIGGGFYDPWWGYGWGPYWDWGPGWGPGYSYGPDYGYVTNHAPGALKLKVTGPDPKLADVYANGSFVGTVDDFNGFFQELHLRPGQYHMEIRADGFKPLDFNVLIPPGQTITYHGELEPAQ
jgi:hypothetical protein